MPAQTDTSVASQEFDISYADLMDMSPHDALLSFHARHDLRIEQVSEESSESKACAEGCGYCCHLKVVADAVEIFAMVEHAKACMDQQQLDQIIERAKQNIEQARHLNHEQQATINQQCPLLKENSCMVYPVRSIKCRNYHATDQNSCRASYQNPTDLTILNHNITELYITATGSSNGFMAALHHHGYDDRIYDHNAAFIEALEDPSCRVRYDAGKRAFKTAKFNNE